MPVGDKQKLITEIVSIILEEKAQNIKFDWFINQHQERHFKQHFDLIDRIYLNLKGNGETKRSVKLESDAYFGGKYNFLFEFDEIQHFTSARSTTLTAYPFDLKLNYSLQQWKKNCLEYSKIADKYRFKKTTIDFAFEGGRTCQRAYLDCFRDLLPTQYGLNPTLRISEFEVAGIGRVNDQSIQTVQVLLNEKLKYL